MTRHPKITASNYKQVYDYYRTPRMHPRFNEAVLSVSHALYKPEVHFQPHAIESLKQQLALGKGALLAMNHPSAHDPFVMAGAFQEIHETVPGFRDFMGFGKDSLFRGPTRPLFEKTGCVPVFRRDSYPDLDPRTFADLTHELFMMSADRLRHGNHVSLMPEGTRSGRENIEHIDYSAIKTGLARIALLAGSDHSFIVPVGIRYRNETPGSLFVPKGTAVVIGEPIIDYAPTANGVRRQLVEGMQSALTDASDFAKR